MPNIIMNLSRTPIVPPRAFDADPKEPLDTCACELCAYSETPACTFMCMKATCNGCKCHNTIPKCSSQFDWAAWRQRREDQLLEEAML